MKEESSENILKPGKSKSSARLIWGVVAMALFVTALSLLMAWRLDRVQRRASAVSQCFLPIVRHLNMIQGRWQAYQKTFEQNVGFRHWGLTSKKNENNGSRAGIEKAFGEEVQMLQNVVRSADATLSSEPNTQKVLGAVSDWIQKVRNLQKDEVEFFSILPVKIKAGDYSTAARMYSNFRSQLAFVFAGDWSALSHEVELAVHENQLLLESELQTSQNSVLLFLIAMLLSSLVVLLKMRRWVNPVVEWTEVAREIALHGAQSGVRMPAVHSGMPEELQILTREFGRMATTIAEREKTITEQKKKLEAAVETEKKLTHAKKLLVAANMSSQVAHEVRNPLNSMGLQLEMLGEDLQEQLGKESPLIRRVATVSEQVQRLERITDRYLNLGALNESSSASASSIRGYVSLSLHQLIEESVEFLSSEIHAAGIRLELSLNAKPDVVRGDRDSLSQVLFNLLRNALDAVSEGQHSSQPWVRISTANQGPNIVVRVEDNGPGISTELRRKVFEPFVTTKAQGHGLGLSISRQICLDHGGELQLITIPERKGAAFDMRVPCGS